MAQPTIETNGIEIKSPSAVQLTTLIRLFKTMFGARPVVKIRGAWYGSALKPRSEGRPVDDLNLSNEFHQVIHVGRLYVSVDLGPGMGSETLIPDQGRQVVVRLTLPTP